MNKKFLFILTISLISLVALVGGFFLFKKDSSLIFKQDGYILETTQTSSNKYYFSKGTKYKENLEDKYEFIDVDNTEVASSKDNFIHYLDNSIVFLKNGVILDVDNVNSSIVPYYNITNKSIINYVDNKYTIKSLDKTLVFNNFIGRISENKYIVAGNDVNLKLSTSSDKINVKYLEILFVENGIVNIENQEISYQVVAEDNYIYIGEHVIIDLGKKKVYYDLEDKLSLTQMTIDGNENIEIIPEEENDDSVNNSNTVNNDTNNVTDNNNNNNNNNNVNNTNTTGNGGGTGSSDEKNNIPSVNLISASVNANKIEASVQIIDSDNIINNDLIVNITNTTTGKRVYSSILDIEEGIANINVETLSPDSNYLLSIGKQTNEGENQYFQKLFRTDTLGISLDKDYATTDSLNYIVTIDEDSDVSSVNLYLYDENYQSLITRDIGNGNIVDYYTITKNSNNGESINIGSLTKNTSYTAVINNVVYNNVEYIDKYTISKTNKTLKTSPTVSNLKAKADEDKQLFTLSINEISDPDNSITKYSYLIYDADDLVFGNSNINPIKTIEKKDMTSVDLNIDGTIIEQKHDYRFRVLVEYYDNEKYGEYLTELSDPFLVSGRPQISFTLDEENTSFNKIVGTIKLEDDNCTVSLVGRSCSNNSNNIVIQYNKKNSTNYEVIENITFDSTTLMYDLELSNLIADSDYEIKVYADVNLKDGQGIREGYLLGTINASTTSIDSLVVSNWKQIDSTSSEPIDLEAKIVSMNNKDNLINSVNSLTFNLYKGNFQANPTALENETPIKSITVNNNIKSNYYNKTFSITSNNLFGITLKNLKDLSGGSLSQYYTIEITDAYDALMLNEVPIESNVYSFEMSSLLILEDQLEDPTIEVLPIQNVSYKKDKDLNDDTVVGYKVSANVDMLGLLNYYSQSAIKSINFYVYDSKGREVGKQVLDLPTTNYYVEFDVGNGTNDGIDDYSNCSKNNLNNYSCLLRGNDYTFKYNVSVDTGISIQNYPSEIVSSQVISALKQAPKYKMFIDGSTSNSITYKYQFIDIDNALYKESNNYFFYYSVNNEEKGNKIIDIDSDYNTSKNNYSNFNINNASKSVSFDGLTNNSKYELYIKRRLSKNKDIEKVSIGKYTFDGSYELNDLSYQVVYSNNDNRLRIIIDKDDNNGDLLKRISAYELTISDGNNSVVNVYTGLNTCNIGSKTYDCIIINYTDIIDFKGKDTTVSLKGYYDNGKYLGFGNKNVNLAILQTNSTETGMGEYLKLTYTNGALSSVTNPTGIYRYTLNNTQLILYTKIDESTNKYAEKNKVMSLSYAENGVMGNTQSVKSIINPKEVSITNFSTTNNYFRFDSITPKISVETESSINSVTLSITSSDITNDILEEEFIKEDGEYYFYVDFYKSLDSDVYRHIKIKYSDLEDYEIKDFLPETKYYFRVYAYMLKNNTSVYTRLFDSSNINDYVCKDYSFSTLSKNEIYNNTTNAIGNVNGIYSTNNVVDYTTRYLYFYTGLSNKNNYTLKYELLEGDSVIDTWNVTNLFEKNNIETSIDITNKDLIFGSKHYKLKVTAITKVFNDNMEEIDYEYILFNDYINTMELQDPTFAVVKNAGYDDDNSNYYLEFKITPIDTYNVIKEGTYRIELLDSNNHVVESISDIDGTKINNVITFNNNLTSDTEYTLVIYADVYKNNVTIIKREESESVESGTYTNSTIKEQYVMYTVGEAKVSLGSLVLEAFEDNITTSFVGGANIIASTIDPSIKGITEVMYTIKQGSNILASDCYVIGDNTPIYCENQTETVTRKNFQYTLNEDYYKLVIDPTGLKLKESVVYTVNISFYSSNTLLRGRTLSYPVIYTKE